MTLGGEEADTAASVVGVLAACIMRVNGVRFEPEQLGHFLDHDVVHQGAQLFAGRSPRFYWTPVENHPWR